MDIFKSKTSILISVLEYVRVYLDDVSVLTKDSFEDHQEKPEQVLAKIPKAGLMVNPKKSSFCIDRIENLGYLLTCKGLKASHAEDTGS